MTNQRPILFSTAMVQAILAGSKTQTRRVIKPQPVTVASDVLGRYFEVSHRHSGIGELQDEIKCPYGKVGDVLWVREEHYRFGHWEHDNTKKRKSGRQAWKFVPDSEEVRYFDNPPNEYRKGRYHKDPYTPAWHKRLARFMPKSLCRINLAIANVRVERLQDISEQDAIAEGIEIIDSKVFGQKFANYELAADKAPYVFDPTYSFESLWRAINGQGSWDSNPWVWVVEFEILHH